MRVFDELTPERVITLVEDALGEDCTSRCVKFNSYINRVYEVLPRESPPVIVKFYRPGRWSPEALRDELEFLMDLHEADVPVIPPIADDPERALHQVDGMTFALFPKMGGRPLDEPNEEQWEQLGRLVGRVHRVGAEFDPDDRITLDADIGRANLSFMLEHNLIPAEVRAEYEDAANDILDDIAPLFDDARDDFIRVHGDLHYQNLIDRPDEHIYIIDFDDMAVGPPVQDIWMLLPGRYADTRWEIERFLSGYETFHEFKWSSLRLIEPLRALRFLHYVAWCARQAVGGGYVVLAPDFGTEEYWRREAGELVKQRSEIRKALEAGL